MSVARYILALAACVMGMQSWAINLDQMVYHDCLEFTLINKGFKDSTTPFTRLPQSLEPELRDGLRVVANNSAGIAVRFATDSKAIGVRYMLTNNFHMNHMADTGTKGTDLYIRHEGDGTWHFVATSVPSGDSITNKKYVDNLDGKMHEYMIYLPLYDGIKKLEIGVDSTATITKPQVNSPRAEKKIVFYGTSITQGGCASRTGMVSSSILSRWLDVECVNLGFSGQGRMDPFVAEAMASIPDVAAYVIDAVSNCKLERIDTIAVEFINILRNARPDVPIFIVEGQQYAQQPYDAKQRASMEASNAMLFSKYEELKKQNPTNLYYIYDKNLIGPDGEGTVDGAHLTDYGFVLNAQKFYPFLKAAVNGEKIPIDKK